jgi:hypothetical protein
LPESGNVVKNHPKLLRTTQNEFGKAEEIHSRKFKSGSVAARIGEWQTCSFNA